MDIKTYVPPEGRHASAPRTERLHSLDGLRGLAAVVVVVHHALLTIPLLAAAYYTSAPPVESHPLAWLAAYTPLHLLWAGGEAVYLFFILSGLVLGLQSAGRPRHWWIGYYPRRLIRLYAPVLAAVLIAYLTVAAVPRSGAASLGPWLAARPGDLSAGSALADITVVGGVSDVLSPLWSLQWEVLFSLLLPLFVMFSGMMRQRILTKALMVAAALAVGDMAEFGPALYMPMFAAGMLMAAELPRLRAWAACIGAARRPRRTWLCLLVLSLLLLCLSWLLQPLSPPRAVSGVTTVLTVVGAALLIFISAFWRGACRVLESRACQKLGALSFSLYLMHEPIVIGSALLVGVDRPWLSMPIAAVATIAATVAFYRAVEKPSHVLARAAGSHIDTVVSMVRPETATARSS